MSSFPFLSMFAGSEIVSNADYLDINFSAANFNMLPIVNFSIEQNIETYVSDLTLTTARLNFSSKYSGRITYLIRPASE